MSEGLAVNGAAPPYSAVRLFDPSGRPVAVRVATPAAVELAFTPEFDLSTKLLRSMFPPDDGGA